MEFANQRWFDRPDTRMNAMGHDWKRDYRLRDIDRKGEIEGRNGGMVNPQPFALSAQTIIVRFAQNGVPALGVQGEWWLEWSEYRKVETYADVQKIDVAEAVRRLCAVPLEWSAMDIVVQARLSQPLMAYAGFGRPAVLPKSSNQDVSNQVRLLALTHVQQLYIPGLGDPDLRHDVLLWSSGHLKSAKRYRTSGY